MKHANNNNNNDDFIKNDFPRRAEWLSQHLDFERWNFRLTHTGIISKYQPYIIYESNQCKIRVRWDQDRAYESAKLYVDYGRLHAPIDEYYMLWNGETCYCWHEIGKVLNFLDGLTPSDTNNREFMLPREIKAFSKKNRSLIQNQQEYIAKLHAHIWDSYGQRLFTLFDLRYPELWNEYTTFLKEYYTYRDEQNKLKGIPPSPIKHPLYKVC